MNFNDMLRRAALRHPAKTFLCWADKDRSMTYREGWEISGQVAGALAQLGVVKGDRVGIFAHNGLDYLTAMFGAWRLGAISCHINVLEAENIAYFVRHATPRVLIYTHDMFPFVAANRVAMPSVEHYVCLDGEQEGAWDWNQLIGSASAPPEVVVAGDDPAHLSYTSGSSGKPKGALLAHGPTARATQCIAERLRYTTDDVTLGPTSPASSYGLVVNWLPALHRCATIGLMSRWEPETGWDELDRRGVTVFPANPLIFADLLRVSREKGRPPRSLRLAPSGGAPLPVDLKKAFQDELGVFLVESYGQSELGGFVALGYPQPQEERHFNAIGPALPDKEVRILNEAGEEVPVGEPGEMCLRGGCMLRYWEQPEKTAEVLGDG